MPHSPRRNHETRIGILLNEEGRGRGGGKGGSCKLRNWCHPPESKEEIVNRPTFVPSSSSSLLLFPSPPFPPAPGATVLIVPLDPIFLPDSKFPLPRVGLICILTVNRSRTGRGESRGRGGRSEIGRGIFKLGVKFRNCIFLPNFFFFHLASILVVMNWQRGREVQEGQEKETNSLRNDFSLLIIFVIEFTHSHNFLPIHESSAYETKGDERKRDEERGETREGG